MTTITYKINTNSETKKKVPKRNKNKSLWESIKQLNPLNWFNTFSDIEINMEEFSTKKTIQKTN